MAQIFNQSSLVILVGLTAAQIAEQLGISRRRFFDWMNALNAGGLARLLERQHGGGAAPQVKGDALAELLAGLQSGQWKRAKEIQHWLRDRDWIRLKLPGVYSRFRREWQLIFKPGNLEARASRRN